MSGQRVAASLLERARLARDSLDSRLWLAAAVQRVALGVGARSVVAGGTSVDFYAAGATGTSESLPAKWQASADVDLVVFAIEGWSDARANVLRALEDVLGLRPRYLAGTARVVDVPDYAYGLEIVGDELRGDARGERVFTVLLEGEHPVTFRGPEDTILSYAESGWHLRHDRDWERALAVFSAMREKLDIPWMIDEAERRGQRPAIDAVLRLEPSPWKRRPAPEDE